MTITELPLYPRCSANCKHWLTANHGVPVPRLVFHAKERAGCSSRWEGQDEHIANIMKYVVTHKELREISLILKRGYQWQSFDIALAKSICQAFLANPFVAVDSKRFYVEVDLKEKHLKEISGLLQVIPTAIVEWSFDPDGDYTRTSYKDSSGMLAEMVASIVGLQRLNLKYIGRSVVGEILKELANTNGGCRIRDLCLDEFKAPPPSLSNFLFSESGSCLQTITVGLRKESSGEEVGNLTQALLQLESLNSMELLITNDLSLETFQILSQYFKNESNLKTLQLDRYINAADDDRAIDSLQELLSGIQANTSITDLDLGDLDLGGLSLDGSAVGKAMEEFFQQCQVKKLILSCPFWEEIQVLADGLRHNQFVHTLDCGSSADYDGENNELPLAKMLTLPEPPLQIPTTTLENIVLNCGIVREDQDLSHLFDLVRRPIPTLKSIHLELSLEGDTGEGHITALLDALKDSSGVESFGLEVADAEDVEECFESLRNVLPQLSNVSCLTFKIKQSATPSNELKLQLYQSALLNNGLTSLTLEPLCELDPQFKLSLKSICTRNKARKALAGLQDYSLSLGEVPVILEDIQRDCQEMGVSPEQYNTDLINASLRQSAEPETMQLIGNYLAAKPLG